MKLLHVPIYAMYLLMFLALGVLAAGCGSTDCPQALSYNNTAGTNRGYQRCLEHNTNYCQSPAWYYFVQQCAQRHNVTLTQYPPCNYYNGREQ